MAWDGWPFTRVGLLFSAAVALLVLIQVTMNHYRQNFRHWSQWLPIIELPLLALAALLVAISNGEGVRTFLMLVGYVGLVGGLTGFYMHFKGVGQRVDGYRLHNFLVGPPVILPLLVSAVSGLALLALYWS
jgi:lysylphosphatidylglycerol synthetase-like protein (DUF2156 family)